MKTKISSISASILCLGLCLSVCRGGDVIFTPLAAFGGSNGMNPIGPLVLGTDGNFYGTTSADPGSIYRITTDGIITTVASFNYTNGAHPVSGLTIGADGAFYGTTYNGGLGYGTVFRATTNGELTMLAQFDSANGAHPQSGVVQATDGNLYGTTYEGGEHNLGTVYRLTTNGALTTLISFNGTNGQNPYADLVQGPDGNLYGNTSGGGAISGVSHGTLFRITTDGALTTLISFNGTNGATPYGAMIIGSDGDLYGTTTFGGGGYAGTQNTGSGTFFSLTTNGVLTTLAQFPGTLGLRAPATRLLELEGDFYGVTAIAGLYGWGGVFRVTKSGGTSLLVSFDYTHAGNPRSGLTLGSDGNLYGTAPLGGPPVGGGPNVPGVVYRICLDGPLTTLHSFDGTNGNQPNAALVEGADGNFYGTTYGGGVSQAGNLYRMTPAGLVTNLFSFGGTNGANPVTSLVQSSNEDWYGTTAYGGAWNSGTVFRMNSNAAVTVVTSFDGTNGSSPDGSFFQASDGNFYGTTPGGGTNGGHGTVFRLADGVLTTVFSFNGTNGSRPNFLMETANGKFLGTTTHGGAIDAGTIFQLSSNGVLTTLLSLDGTNGSRPTGLAQDDNGSLYCTARLGGANQKGTIFRMTTNGLLTTLLDFNGTNGCYPISGLLRARDGNFYGLTFEGGPLYSKDDLNGTLFRMSPNGSLTTLAWFHHDNGARPAGRLIEAKDGHIYGVARHGSSQSEGFNYLFRGTIFRLSLQPNLRAISLTTNTVRLTWNTAPELSYQVQFTTNLLQPDWMNLGDVIIANSGTMTRTFSNILSSPQGFYRIGLLP